MASRIPLKAVVKDWVEDLAVMRPLISRTLLRQPKSVDPHALHIIVPHRANWKLTEACVRAYARLTSRPYQITVVCNFDQVPDAVLAWPIPQVAVIDHQITWVGRGLGKFFSKENGSKSNAIALDAAIRTFPDFEWAFMSHNDSAPLIKDWDQYFFSGIQGDRIIGNYRDKIRIHAAHASGTLFSQRDFVRSNGSMYPLIHQGDMKWDVGDRATVLLHGVMGVDTPKAVPVLPNTLNDPDMTEKLDQVNPQLAALARNGSAISFDLSGKVPVFGHLGRGTPRSANQAAFSKLLPVDLWIDLLDRLEGARE